MTFENIFSSIDEESFKAGRQWAFVVFWLSSCGCVCKLIGAKKGRSFQFNLFLWKRSAYIKFRIIMPFRKPCHMPFRKLIPPITLTANRWTFNVPVGLPGFISTRALGKQCGLAPSSFFFSSDIFKPQLLSSSRRLNIFRIKNRQKNCVERNFLLGSLRKNAGVWSNKFLLQQNWNQVLRFVPVDG